jgi:hypothetical protein
LLRVANVINHRHAFGLVNNHGGLDEHAANLGARLVHAELQLDTLFARGKATDEKAWSPKSPRLSSPPVVHGLGTDLTDRLFVVTRRLKIYNGAELEARMPIMKTATRFQFWAVRFIFREEAAQ